MHAMQPRFTTRRMDERGRTADCAVRLTAALRCEMRTIRGDDEKSPHAAGKSKRWNSSNQAIGDNENLRRGRGQQDDASAEKYFWCRRSLEVRARRPGRLQV